MKTIKRVTAFLLTFMMILSSVPMTEVFADPIPGMTLEEFSAEIKPRMQDFYANATPEQMEILKAMGDELAVSSLSPYTTVSASWDTILDGLLNETFIAKYSSQEEAKEVLAKIVYSVLELMFYSDTNVGTTEEQKLDSAIDNAYINCYLPLDNLVGSILTQSAVASVLDAARSDISDKLSTYANAIMNAMNASSTTTYVNIIANSIASVAVTRLFDDATSGDLFDIKNSFATNAGFSTTNLGDLVKKIYLSAASVKPDQKAPSVQFNVLINSVIKFQGTDKNLSTPIYFDEGVTLNSATGDEVNIVITPDRAIGDEDLDMTLYFVAGSPDINIISVAKFEDTTFGGYYIKLKAMPNVANSGTYYVNVYRNSVGAENYFFNIKVDVVGIGALAVINSGAATLADYQSVASAATAGLLENYKRGVAQKRIEKGSDLTEAEVIALVAQVNTPEDPVISNIVITGQAVTGSVLSVTYDYYDANYDLDTQEIIWTVGTAPLSQESYTVAVDDIGKVITVSVLGILNNVSEGSAVIRRGDVNKDGKIKSDDAFAIRQIYFGAIGFTNQQKEAADFDISGEVHANDYADVLAYSAMSSLGL